MAHWLPGWHIQRFASERVNFTETAVLNQIHTSNLLTTAQALHGAPGDGVILHPDTPPVAIETADCMALVLTTKNQAIALHISRKTLLHSLVEHALVKLAHENITGIFLGPHICPRHFTFSDEGKEIVAFKEKFPMAWQQTDAGISLSLKIAVMSLLTSLVNISWRQVLSAPARASPEALARRAPPTDGGTAVPALVGGPPEHHPSHSKYSLSSLPSSITVISDDRCTYETPDLPSYRRWLDGGKVGQRAHLYTVIRPLATSA